MSMKVVLVAAASVLAVSPAFAMSNSEIVHHTGGPIPYSQLVSMDNSGYSARSHKSKKAAANTTATAADQSAAPAAPTPSAAPDANVTPSPTPAPAAPDASPSPAAPPAAAPSSPGAAPQ